LLLFPFASFATPSQNILQFLANAECEYYPEFWSELGKSDCDFTSPKVLSEHVDELKFYSRWKGFITEFKQKNTDLGSQQTAVLLDWYVDNKKREINLRADREIIEVFYPTRAALSHFNDLRLRARANKPELLVKKLQNYYSDQRIEAEWHRLVFLRKKYPEGLLPDRNAIKDYLSHSEKEMAELAEMLGPEGAEEVDRFRKMVNRYNSYLSGKIVPIAKEDITTDPTWYQQLLEQEGIGELSSEIASSAAEELKAVMSKSSGNQGSMQVPLLTNIDEASRLYVKAASSYESGLRWYVNDEKLRGNREMKLMLARAFLSPRLHLGKIKQKDAEKFLKDEIDLSQVEAKSVLRDILYLNPAQGPAAYGGLMAFRNLQKKMRKVWGVGFSETCFIETLKKMSPAPWETFEESLRQQLPCKP